MNKESSRTYKEKYKMNFAHYLYHIAGHNILIWLKDNDDGTATSYKLTYELHLAYSHVSHILHKMSDEGLIIWGEKKGREKPIKLTLRGLALAEQVERIDKILLNQEE